jgi:hypothetical protein
MMVYAAAVATTNQDSGLTGKTVRKYFGKFWMSKSERPGKQATLMIALSL